MRGLTDGHHNAKGERYPVYRLHRCPACHQALQGYISAPISVLPSMELGHLSRSFITALVGSYPRNQSSQDLIAYIWPDKKPVEPETNLRQIVMAMRRKIKPYGWNIGSTRGGYRLYPRK